MSASDRMLIPVHDTDLVLYAVATPAAMREAMVRAFEFAKGRCVPPDEVELVDEETGEIRTRQLRIVIGPDLDPMTVKQRRFYHGVVLKQIHEQMRDPDTGRPFLYVAIKEHYRKTFLGTNGIRWEHYKAPGEKRARPHAVRMSTEDLSVKQYSELIDKVIADASEAGVAFEFDQQEREAVRWRRRARRPAQAAQASDTVAA
jgi:hypothetical protein